MSDGRFNLETLQRVRRAILEMASPEYAERQRQQMIYWDAWSRWQMFSMLNRWHCGSVRAWEDVQ